MVARLRAGEQLERDAIICIDPHVVARLQGRLRQLRRTLQDERLRAMLRADAQPVIRQHLCDLGHGAGLLETEIAHDDVGFVDQNPRSLLQLRQADARIDIAIIIRAADHDLRRVARRAAKKSADAIRRRGHLFDHLLELLDHLARVAHHLFLRCDFGPKRDQPVAGKIIRRQEQDRAIERLEQTDLALVVRRTALFPVLIPFVAHSLFPSF